jgi:hypothetical protein
MRSLPQIILLLVIAGKLYSQNPHGQSLKMDCAACHQSASWEISAQEWQDRTKDQYRSTWEVGSNVSYFSHASTGFPLEGRHALVDCRECHSDLLFSNTPTHCVECHTDVHQQTVGFDCARCHTPAHWLVDQITDLHQQNGFPLLGQHLTADCIDCHQSESHLRFDRIGNDCINCHLVDYKETTSPNHQAAGYSTDCVVCHDPQGSNWMWTVGGANHLFFPLTQGHQISDCSKCHQNGTFMNTPTDCFACHEADFRATTQPDHEGGGFPTDCMVCHTTAVGWPANDFKEHDNLYFPIYSGKHQGEWNQCIDCHTTAGNYKIFSCIDCHEHKNAGDLADDHDDVNGYVYASTACYTCHPKGDE